MTDLQEYIVERMAKILSKDKEHIKEDYEFYINIMYSSIIKKFNIDEKSKYIITDEITEHLDDWIKKTMVYSMD